MVGSLKSLSKALDGLLTVDPPPKQLTTDVEDTIKTYVEHHTPIDSYESKRLNDELWRLYRSRSLETHSERNVLFISALSQLCPCLINIKEIRGWFELYSKPAIDSAGYKNSLVKSTREFLLQLLLCGTDSDNSASGGDNKIENMYRENSHSVATSILDIHLGNTILEREPGSRKSEQAKLNETPSSDAQSSSSATVKTATTAPLPSSSSIDAESGPKNKNSAKSEERHRFAKANAKVLLLQYGSKRPREFFNLLNEKFITSVDRIGALTLLSAYVALQPPHLFQIQNTSLLENLYICLQRDISSTGLSIAATVLAMILPHICDTLVPQLPKLYAIYGRLASWQYINDEDQYDNSGTGDSAEKAATEESSANSSADVSTVTSPTSPPPTLAQFTPIKSASSTSLTGIESAVPSSSSPSWQTLGHLYKIQDQRSPLLSPLFTFLYGLFPSNTLAFLRRPSEYLQEAGYKGHPDFWDKSFIQSQSKELMSQYTLNPELLSLSSNDELTDNTRWRHMGSPTDIATKCLSLYNYSYASAGQNDKIDFRQPFEELESYQDSPGMILAHSEGLPDDFGFRSVKRADLAPTPTGQLSPGMLSLDALLNDHEQLYSKRDKEHDPDDLSLDEGAPAVSGASGGISTFAPGLSRRRSRQRSSAFLQQQPTALSEIASTNASANDLVTRSPVLGNQSMTASVTSLNAYATMSPRLEPVHSAGSAGGAVTGNVGTSLMNNSSEIEQLYTTISFYQRELMLLKNELDFVSFIEQHSQYRFKKLKEQLSETAVAHAKVDELITQNRILKAKLEGPELEQRKFQNSFRTYKSERRAYEGMLVAKNKDFRAQITASKQEIDELKRHIEDLANEKKGLMASALEKETKISRLELELEDLNARLAAQTKDIEQPRKEEAQNETSGSTAENEQKVIQLEQQILSLQMDIKTVEKEKADLYAAYSAKIAELKSRVKEYAEQSELKGTKNVDEMMQQYKEMTQAKYDRLHQAHEDLLARYNEAAKSLRDQVINEEERRARIDQPLLPKRSLLGYDIHMSSSDETSSNASHPIANKPETRVKGRGGVQNLARQKR